MPKSPAATVIRTLRFKVRGEGYAWLQAAAVEVNRKRNKNRDSVRADGRVVVKRSATDIQNETPFACKTLFNDELVGRNAL